MPCIPKFCNAGLRDCAAVAKADLISAATAEKTALIERLRAYFDEMSKQKLLERRSLEADYRQKELLQVPYTIYIG
jgi:hypothetical protein